MKQIANQLQDAVLRTMGERSVPPDQRTDYLKWLRYHLHETELQKAIRHAVRTTRIYTHTVKSRTIKEMASPLDFSPDEVACSKA